LLIQTEMSFLNDEIAKSRVHIIVKIIEYVPNAIVSKTIIKKTTGNITVMSFDTGEELAEKIPPFDTFVQVIDGSAEITINKSVHLLQLGEGMIIPAHTLNRIKANQRFKVLLTTIKSGYEE
jgi:quercetin dioxygenase-like cupin family protein